METAHVFKSAPIRRAALVITLVAWMLATVGCPAVAQPGEDSGREPRYATGSVFHDSNHNGLRDLGEEGLPGVRVSNGRSIVHTEKDGRYRIRVGDDTIIFVIKPSDWMTAVDRDNLPRFYYIHKPNGSPKVSFGGVEPTGPLPDSVDFPLYPRKEPSRFQVVFLADPQVVNEQEVDYLARDIVQELVGTDAAFGVTLGDIVMNDLSLFEDVAGTMGRVGIPWYNVIGNHDSNYDGQISNQFADESFERVFGPSYYSFDYGRVHFVVLDDIYWTPPDAWYSIRLDRNQMAFLRNDLALVPQEQLVVLMMHIPIVDEVPNQTPSARILQQEIFRLLETRPHTFSIAGHWHAQRHFLLGKEDGWNGETPHHHLVNIAACGILWAGALDEAGIPHGVSYEGEANGYTIATFDGNRYSLRFKAARRPADYQMNVYAPDEVKIAEAEQTWVFANVFAGWERLLVEMRLDHQGPWLAMHKTDEADPSYLVTVGVDAETSLPAPKKLPYIGQCAHLWKASLPGGLSAGTHLIEVRTTDMFGQTYAGCRVVRVR